VAAISFDKSEDKPKRSIMKQVMFTLAVLLNAYMLSACSINIGADRSAGHYERDAAGYGANDGVIERSLSVRPFTALECRLPAAVTYVQTNDQAPKVVLKGAPAMVERCVVDVHDGKLLLRLAQNTEQNRKCFSKSWDKLNITVYGGQLTALAVQSACTFYAERLEMPQLALSNSGASTIRVGRLVGQRLTMSCSGASSTKLAGNVAQLMLNVTGASSFVANEFATQDLKAKVSGASTAKCALQGSAGVDVSGASTLTLSGTSDSFTIKCSGASNVKAAGLRAQDVLVDVSGASGVKCYAERSIKGTVGCGSLTYGGHPTSFNVERKNSTASIKAVD
jgi:putative lipoprotein